MGGWEMGTGKLWKEQHILVIVIRVVSLSESELFLHDAMAYVIPCPELAESYGRKRKSANGDEHRGNSKSK